MNKIEIIKIGDIEVPVEYLRQTTVNVNGDDYIRLQQENQQLKEKIYDLNCYLSSGDFKSNFESINNEVYIRAKIKDIIGLSMSEEEFKILKNRYFKIDVRPSFTTRKLKEAEGQLYKIKKLIGSYDEISTLENEIYRIIGDSNE